MIEYIFLNPFEKIPYNLLQPSKEIISFEYKLQQQVFNEQNNINPPKEISYEEWENNRINNKVYYYIVIEDNKLLGCISFFENSQECNSYYNIEPRNSLHISQFYVDENYRNRKIGITLLLKVEKFAKTHSFKLLDLKTSYKNTIAQSLYFKFGFNINFITVSKDVKDYINNRTLTPLSIINISNTLNNYINNSILSLSLINNNGFSFNQIKDNIVKNINNGIYRIFKYDKDLYSIYRIFIKKSSLKLYDVLGNKEEKLFVCMCLTNNFCKNANLKKIESTILLKDKELYENSNFECKMLHMIKNI